ncbi:MAG: hypothetical protein NCW75_06095 [Phycisphaera sp.]|nr:MAG: hypothetical protein NCW75_06095 [Phycisphaera sp.]
MSRRPPRILGWRLVLVSVVVGVAANAASIGMGTWRANHGSTTTYYDATRWPAGRASCGRGHQVMQTRTILWRAWACSSLDNELFFDDGFSDMPRRTPNAMVRRATGDQTTVATVIAVGLPLRATWAFQRITGPHGVVQPWRGIERVTYRGREWGIPLLPRWSGLVGNTVVYAATLLGVVLAIRGLRFSRRRHQNRCIACGYDLAGGNGMCPECGTLDPKANGAVA